MHQERRSWKVGVVHSRRDLEETSFRVGGINTERAIRQLADLNGIPMAELERRMRPNKAEGKSPGMYSYDGFLGKDESLVESLLRANQIVIKNCFTHQQLASWLELAMQVNYSGKKNFEYNGMRYEIFHTGTHSKGQESPFRNPNLRNDPEEGWDGLYTLRNLTTGRAINFAPPLCRWIRQWGFYEGFGTPYHVNPQEIIDIFTKKDRVYETWEELTARYKREYQKQGWKKIAITSPDMVLSSNPFLYKALVRYEDDPKGKEKVVQVLEDDSFLVATLGFYNPFVRFDFSFVVYDKQARRFLAASREVAEFEIKRITGGRGVVIKTAIRRKDEPEGEIIVSSEIDKEGWLVRKRGSCTQVEEDGLFEGYKGDCPRYSSLDQVEAYRNGRIDFLVQDLEGSGVICLLYKKDRLAKTAERILLTEQVLEKRFGIKARKGEYISGVKNISVDKDGKVTGIMVVGGRRESFQW